MGVPNGGGRGGRGGGKGARKRGDMRAARTTARVIEKTKVARIRRGGGFGI